MGHFPILILQEFEPVRGGGGELSLGEGRRRDTWAHLIASGPDAARQIKADEAGEAQDAGHEEIS